MVKRKKWWIDEISCTRLPNEKEEIITQLCTTLCHVVDNHVNSKKNQFS